MPTVASLTARIGADIGGLESGLRQAEGKVNSFASRLNSIGTKLTLGVTAPLVGLAAASVRSATQMDSLKRGLRAVAGSAAEADRQLARLREIAKLPGLGRVEAIQASTQLQAAGLSAKLAEESLLAFGNALATVGKGKAELQGVTLALTQITAKGKVTAEEINQIAERVPQIRVAMQAAFGTANTELLQKMGLTARQFIEGINQELLKLERVTGGAQNAFENLSDVVGEALGEIGNNILPTLLPIVERVTNALVDLTKRFASLSPEVRKAILVVGGLVALAGPAILFLGQFKAAATALGVTLPGLLGGLRAIALFMTGPWGLAIAAAVLAIQGLRYAWEQNLGGMRDFTNEWFPRIQTLLEFGWQTIVDGAKGYFAELGQAWSAMWKAAGEEFGGFVGSIFKWLGNLPGMGEFLKRLDFYRLATATPEQLLGGPVVPYTGEKPAGGGGGIDLPTGKAKLTPYQQQLKSLRELETQLERVKQAYALGLKPELRDLMGQFTLLDQATLQHAANLQGEISQTEKQISLREELRKGIQALQVEIKNTRGLGGEGFLEIMKRGAGILDPQELSRFAEKYAELNVELKTLRKNQEAAAAIEQRRRQINQQLTSQIDTNTAAMARLTGITDVYKFSIAELGIRFAELNEAQQREVTALFKAWQDIQQSNQWVENFRQMAEGMQSVFSNAFMNLSQGFGSFFQNVYAGFRSLLQRMAAEYLSSRIASVFTQLLGSVLGGNFGGIMGKPGVPAGVPYGVNTGGLSGAIKGSFGDLTLRQHGGPVSAGRSYLVGEAGPELFVPRRSGQIMANQQMAAAGPVTVVFNIATPDVDSFRRNQRQLMADAYSEAERARRRNG